MKTPTGKDCKFYYADFNRGRNRQECRLLAQKSGPSAWRPSDCGHCRVPDILWANASEHLELRVHVLSGLFGIGRRVDVTALCRKHSVVIADPMLGCEQCAQGRQSLSNSVVQDEE